MIGLWASPVVWDVVVIAATAMGDNKGRGGGGGGNAVIPKHS